MKSFRNPKPRKKFTLTLILFVFLLTSCVNLQAIQNFARISSEAAEYTLIVNDYIESPERQKFFTPESEHEILDLNTEVRYQQKEILLAYHKEISDYMDALGNLAADELTNYGQELDHFAKVIRDNQFATPEQVDAFTAIAKLLFKAFTDLWRQKKLKELIEASNADFQIVVMALIDIIESFKEGRLTERAVIVDYYEDIIERAHKTEPPQEAGIAALRELSRDRLTSFDAMSERVNLYVKALEQISDGHQKLYDNRNELRDRDFLRQIAAYARHLRALFKAVKNL